MILIRWREDLGKKTKKNHKDGGVVVNSHGSFC